MSAPPPIRQRLARVLIHSIAFVLGSTIALLGVAAPVAALSLSDLPGQPPSQRVLDRADVLSRSGRAEIERRLEELEADRVDARLITIRGLDYGVDLETLADRLLRQWSQPTAGGSGTPLLLFLIDAQTRATAVVAAPGLDRQLPAELLRSTADTTMTLPLRDGDRFRQASLDGLQRISTVLAGGEDPGEPLVEEAEAPIVRHVPSREETAGSNAFTWVVVLLVVGTLVPMITWWVFSR